MFSTICLPKIRFRQGINPFLVQNSNNVTRRRSNPVIKSALVKLNNLQRKILSDNPKFNIKPLLTDEIIIISSPKIKQKNNFQASNNLPKGKSIKNTLEKYFDNSKPENFETAKDENLRQIVEEYEKVTPSTFFQDRVKALYAMKKDALAKIHRGLDLKSRYEKRLVQYGIPQGRDDYDYMLIKNIEKFRIGENVTFPDKLIFDRKCRYMTPDLFELCLEKSKNNLN